MAGGFVGQSWGAWHGHAIEPVIRDALLRIAPELGFPEVAAVDGWWNRRNTACRLARED